MTGAAAAVAGKGVCAGGGLVGVCASLVVEGGTGAEGVGGAVHTACGAEWVGVTAGTASGTALLKRQARSTAGEHFNLSAAEGKPAVLQHSILVVRPVLAYGVQVARWKRNTP